jgi:negative regulator of sigma E activity
MKDLADVKFKQVFEDCNRKIANFKQDIDQQLRLTNDNLIKSEDKTKEIILRVEKALASKIQELKDQTEFKIGKQR